jgi:hypothetical protein
LFAGTELGVFLSWNGGKDWSPFQLNLPITPITDLRVHKGNLIAATSGRSFWILDDMGVIRQLKGSASSTALYRPDPAYLVNGGSELDRVEDEFNGSSTFRGVNPATGIVVYYQLPELKKDDQITIEIKDTTGNIVRSFSSKADEKFVRYEAGPRPDPVLTKAKGLNRFVWDLRYATMVGVPHVRIEGGFAGHKGIPGKYTITLKTPAQTLSTEAEILANPLYPTDAASYADYHRTMSSMEAELTTMHRLVNSLFEKQKQLESLLS